MNNSIWNTCIGEAIRKAKLSGTLIPSNEVDEIISELEKLKRTNSKEPETVHGNQVERKVYYCTFCKTNTVDAENGYDTCQQCLDSM